MTTILHALLFLPQRSVCFLRGRLPGLLLCIVIAGLAYELELAEDRLLGKTWLETMNLALLVGVAIRTIHKPGHAWRPGIHYCSKTLLNIAIVFLGASFSVGAVLAAGPGLLASVTAIVTFSLVFTCLIGRMVGLPPAQTLLVACGNSICGNSAIMAAAPVIHARDEDVGTTIAFTAAGGLVVVLGLPFLGPLLHLDNIAGGALAGLTVYAVPQVVAASAPFGMAAIQMGTLIKLVRVLMLGPVCVVLSLMTPGFRRGEPGANTKKTGFQSLNGLLPWYITGFVVMMMCRSLHVIPEGFVHPLNLAATFLTVLAMGALGLSVDLRSVVRAGRPLMLTVVVSLFGLLSVSLILVRFVFNG